jgi:beta-lactamase superfamily II metal-dependent hydrolase
MNRVALLLIILLLALPTALFGQSLQIHHIAVGQGDCTLIIATDKDNNGISKTVSVLIDGGPIEDPKKVDILYKYILDTITAAGGIGIDFMIVSHLHADHLKGIYSLLRKIYDVTKPVWKDTLRVIDRIAINQKWDDDVDDCWNVKNGDLLTRYKRFRKGKTFKGKVFDTEIGKSIFDIFGFKVIKLTCVAQNGWADGGWQAQSKSGTDLNTPKSENDLSFAFYLQYNAFRYLTAGDCGGVADRYSNLEKPIADYLKRTYKKNGDTPEFHLCSYKVSHHGSDHSTKDDFLAIVKPKSCVIQSALQMFNKSRIPKKATVERLTKAGCAHILMTYIPQKTGDFDNESKDYRDVNLYLTRAPDHGRHVLIKYKMVQRDKVTLKLYSPLRVSYTDVTCDYGHTAP